MQSPIHTPPNAGARNPDPAFWAGRPVLVTGHTGFKGAWLSLWLERLGARMSGLALPPETTPNLFDLTGFSGRMESHLGDIRSADTVRDALSATRPEIVIHMAAQALVRPSYRDPLATYATNVMGTAHVLEAVRATPSVRAVVVVTSDKAYANREWPYGYRETEALGGHDPYSSSKACAELVTSAYRASFLAERDCRVATARAGNVIGGGDWSEDRLIPDIVQAFLSGRSVEIRAPHATRPWQHVLEPLSGYLRLAEALCGECGAGVAEAWNFGPADEDCRPVSTIVETLAREWGEGAAWHLSEKTHPHEATFLKVDASKARAYLGWDRRLRLDTALAWTTAWHRAHAQGASALDLTLAQIGAYETLGA
ncbi:CDP-glucose 4,6-dehydratase [Methylobacterium sp. J-090]|uniref:CDP-glucose 4,6-dehydratase n=1 Tax=Methylobacterium sp. J-090 TaxID=2836666 RepID=UPI001FB9EC28|nr:CDP-glucose 4,6-dehydratase [Methylobacterium sp. J-090]MCJ2081436.1 CDP-glucose 4,6-dehydratase [Methylobacterium sp. J-090]